MQSRGLRNNNPGNIRRSAVEYRGETVSDDLAFKRFETPAWGYRAVFMLLHTYQLRYNLHTLRSMLARYAPPSENDTGAYVSYVAAAAGVSPDERVDTLARHLMIPIVSAISRIENGTDAVPADVEAGWVLFEGG